MAIRRSGRGGRTGSLNVPIATTSPARVQLLESHSHFAYRFEPDVVAEVIRRFL